MDKSTTSKSTVAQQIAQAAIAFQEKRTGHAPISVTVVLGADTLVITLHGAFSPAEQALAKTPEGAAHVRKFHRELFANSCEPLRQEIKRITGVDVREAEKVTESAITDHVGTAAHGCPREQSSPEVFFVI